MCRVAAHCVFVCFLQALLFLIPLAYRRVNSNDHYRQAEGTYTSALHVSPSTRDRSNADIPTRCFRKSDIQVKPSDEAYSAADHTAFLTGFDEPPMRAVRCQTMEGLIAALGETHAGIVQTIEHLRIGFGFVHNLNGHAVLFASVQFIPTTHSADFSFFQLCATVSMRTFNNRLGSALDQLHETRLAEGMQAVLEEHTFTLVDRLEARDAIERIDIGIVRFLLVTG